MTFRKHSYELCMSLFKGYNDLLLTYPIKTKMVTSGIISIFGDTVCQKVIEKKTSQDHSFKRTLRQSTVSSFYGAPLGHLWFGNLLPKIISPFKYRPLKIITSVILDNTLFASYSIATGVFLLELLKTGQVETSINNVQSKFIKILTNSMKFWCIVSLVNHTFVPVPYKVLVGNACGIVWQIYMSYMVNADHKNGHINPIELVSEVSTV